MGGEIDIYRGGELVADEALAAEMGAARQLAAQSRSPRTLAKYERDWRRFADWARARDLEPTTVGLEGIGTYVAHLATGRTDTPTRHPAVRVVGRRLCPCRVDWL